MTNHHDDDIRLTMETAMVLNGGHSHLMPQMTRRDHLLQLHAVYHMMGLEQSRPHDLCMEALAQVEDDLLRGMAAIWS